MTAGDACPGILDLHEARDGHVARVRLPGGYASGARLRAVAGLARGFGDGRVDLTARGNVQLRGLRASEVAALSRRAASTGLLPSPAHDRARNLSASPLAGLAGHPGLRRMVSRLDRAVLADPQLAALPGRFLLAVDDGGGGAGLSACDLGLRRGAGGFDLVVAGHQTGLRAAAASAVTDACALARAFLQQRRAHPEAMRIAELPDGGAAIAAARGGALGDRVVELSRRLPLGPLSDAAPLVVVAAPLGRLSAAQLELLAALLRTGEVARLAAAARIVLPLAEAAGTVLPHLAAAGLLVSDDHPLSGVTACSGSACVRSLADVRAVAGGLREGVAVHWAGCARRCGLPADAVAVVATSADRFTLGDDPTPRRLPALAPAR